MTISELKAIREDHPTGWRGIFDSYPIKTMVSDLPFLFSLLITILGVIAFIVTEKSSYVLLIWFIDMVKSLFPNLLGFCLGGYAILIGFGNTDLLKSLTRKLRSINKSVFQLLSAVFAFSLILQSVSLIISYVFSFFVQFNLFNAPEPICKNLNIYR